MKKLILAATLLAITAPVAVHAGAIENACIQSDRSRGNRALCGCIQQAADMTLRNADQRRAAGFFRDPHQAQEVRMSKSNADNEFWQRYRSFISAAEGMCAG
ncbi:hypothetical protein [Ruixingdingia sedimenti]|uniref:Arginine transporter n=1 Tax=Ruixingdingia sedimenti TaxID=3073604 RepID=A0ABU1F6N8_9RHOB|nr:hypothetical protein [Xinfangfangia sp. LG-4]MDR5652104.1 hypothetical protein [Xinfangfangia sp. LG-4]